MLSALGLKTAAIAAIQKDMKDLVERRSHHLPSNIPHYIQRLVGKEKATSPEPAGDLNPSQPSSVDLSYSTQGERALQQALSILQRHTSWQAEVMMEAGTTVTSAALPGLGKLFRAEVVLAVPVAQLHQELFERIEQMPRWNPTLSQVKVLQHVGRDTLVTHEVAAPSRGNLVGQRDFVSVRHRGRRDAAIYLVGTATHRDPLPLPKGCIRAESRLSCIVLQPLAGDPGRTHLTWLLSMDLKGWVPTSVIDRLLLWAQVDFIKHLHQHLSATTCP
ncbi:steroidogenic acute regulatory protein, mitochondrial-like [Indicator indicator]|uniref:steroidogenic acute regulatory protein, mitochondrial-like n=1 Tax=Indicator indicator TaxID=1002788 RepID=UPI0023DF704F|nr:steroidogenic acute regulatory protein, mitochondrial-like [Indicator indicator]